MSTVSSNLKPLAASTMVETRSGRSVEPDDSPRGGSPEPGPRRDTAASTGAGRGAATPRRRPRVGRGEAAEPSGGQLTTSQSYTLLALELLVFALPCIFAPKLVGSGRQAGWQVAALELRRDAGIARRGARAGPARCSPTAAASNPTTAAPAALLRPCRPPAPPLARPPTHLRTSTPT